MPKRFHFVTLVAVVLGTLPLAGQAQLAPRNPRPIAPAAPESTTSGYGASAGYGTGAASYGVPAGYGAPAGYGGLSTAASDPSRKLQPGDQLSIKIEEDREPGTPLIVSQTGDVIVEPLPQAVRVTNLTLSGAAAEIARLLERDYYHKASVRLTLDRAGEVAVGLVFLSGQVSRIGPLPIPPGRPLMVSQAITAVGGFGTYANERRVQVTRAGRSGTGTERFEVDVKEVITKSRVDLDRQLEDGDRIHVPERAFR